MSQLRLARNTRQRLSVLTAHQRRDGPSVNEAQTVSVACAGRTLTVHCADPDGERGATLVDDRMASAFFAGESAECGEPATASESDVDGQLDAAASLFGPRTVVRVLDHTERVVVSRPNGETAHERRLLRLEVTELLTQRSVEDHVAADNTDVSGLIDTMVENVALRCAATPKRLPRGLDSAVLFGAAARSVLSVAWRADPPVPLGHHPEDALDAVVDDFGRPIVAASRIDRGAVPPVRLIGDGVVAQYRGLRPARPAVLSPPWVAGDVALPLLDPTVDGRYGLLLPEPYLFDGDSLVAVQPLVITGAVGSCAIGPSTPGFSTKHPRVALASVVMVSA